MKFQKDLIKELKAEAVKWVKECCRDDANNEILRCEGCNKMVVFFNITEEDLLSDIDCKGVERAK